MPEPILTQVVLRGVLLAAILLLHCPLASTIPNEHDPLFSIGFQEGSREEVTCADGGFLTGLSLFFVEADWMHTAPYVVGMVPLCSSRKLQRQFYGAHAGGLLYGHGSTQVMNGTCSGGGGVVGLRWRPSALKKAAEIRVAGVVLQCDSEPKEINLDWGVAHQDAEPKDKEYKQFSCHAARQRVNMFSVWQNVKGWTGFEVLGCSSAPS